MHQMGLGWISDRPSQVATTFPTPIEMLSCRWAEASSGQGGRCPSGESNGAGRGRRRGLSFEERPAQGPDFLKG